MGLYKYRVLNRAGTRTEETVDCRAAVEQLIPHGESRTVKRFQGRKKLATYRVERDIRGGVLWRQLGKPGND